LETPNESLGFGSNQGKQNRLISMSATSAGQMLGLKPKTNQRGQIALLMNSLETTISGKQRERDKIRMSELESKNNTPSHDGS
jgi:hypothetical protein